MAGGDGLCVILKGRAQAHKLTEGDVSAASLMPRSLHSFVSSDDAGNTVPPELCPPPREPQVRSTCGQPGALRESRDPEGNLALKKNKDYAIDAELGICLKTSGRGCLHRHPAQRQALAVPAVTATA